MRFQGYITSSFLLLSQRIRFLKKKFSLILRSMSLKLKILIFVWFKVNLTAYITVRDKCMYYRSNLSFKVGPTPIISFAIEKIIMKLRDKSYCYIISIFGYWWNESENSLPKFWKSFQLLHCDILELVESSKINETFSILIVLQSNFHRLCIWVGSIMPVF